MNAITPIKHKSDEDCVIEQFGEQEGRILLAICDQLATNPAGLKEIAAEALGKNPKDEDDKQAGQKWFYRRRIRSAHLSTIYARACASRAHVIAHSLMDTIESEPDGQKARVKLDAVKWLAAKFNRAEFGDDPVTIQGNPALPIQHHHEHTSEVLEEISRRIARKRRALALTIDGGEVVDYKVGGGGKGAPPPPVLPSPTRDDPPA